MGARSELRRILHIFGEVDASREAENDRLSALESGATQRSEVHDRRRERESYLAMLGRLDHETYGDFPSDCRQIVESSSVCLEHVGKIIADFAGFNFEMLSQLTDRPVERRSYRDLQNV